MLQHKSYCVISSVSMKEHFAISPEIQMISNGRSYLTKENLETNVTSQQNVLPLYHLFKYEFYDVMLYIIHFANSEMPAVITPLKESGNRCVIDFRKKTKTVRSEPVTEINSPHRKKMRCLRMSQRMLSFS